MRFCGRLNFCHWLAVSLLLHSSVILPFVFTSLHTPDEKKHNKLVVDLFGMISNRQMEEKKKGVVVAPQNRRVSPPVTLIQIKKVAAPQNSSEKHETEKSETEKYKTTMADSPIPVETGGDREKPAEPATGPTEAFTVSLPAVSAPAIPGSVGGEIEQRQQTIGRGDQIADKIREYLAKLTKRVRDNLIYPEEVRKHGIEGVSTIAFIVTESGIIKDGSLRVRKSSGYASLDSNAMKSALASAPFEKPPKELDVFIGVTFKVEMMRRR